MTETIAQVLGIIAVMFSLLSFQFQKGKTFFLFQILLMVSFSVHFFLLESYSGVALNLIGVLNSLVYYYKSENKKFAQGSVWLYVFTIAYLGAGVVIALSTNRMLEFLPSVAMVFNLFTRYSGNLKAIRFAQLLVSSPFWFTYNLFAHSYGGCLNELLAAGSALIALIRYRNDLKVILKSCAKINLVLSVCGKREDGYHEISSVMQSISLCDKITVKKADKISVTSNSAPIDDGNICFAAAKMFEEFGGADIYIEKNIPMAAGLGGGSSNAAATLIALNALYGNPFSDEKLSEMALSLGADVPFFLMGGTARADGVGEILTPIKSFSGYVVIIKDGVKLSTGAMYRELDGKTEHHGKTDVDDFIKTLENGPIENVANALFNDFELVNACDSIKTDLLETGALGAGLSGSGPSVFGIFADEEGANRCALRLKEKYKEVYVCQTTDKALIIE